MGFHLTRTGIGIATETGTGIGPEVIHFVGNVKLTPQFARDFRAIMAIVFCCLNGGQQPILQSEHLGIRIGTEIGTKRRNAPRH